MRGRSGIVTTNYRPAQRILEVDVSDEMVEKARARQLAERQLAVVLRVSVPFSNNKLTKEEWDQVAHVAKTASDSAVRDAVRETFAILEHFAADELTAEEWPPHGLANEKYRCGDSSEICRRLASALRKKFKVET